MRITRKIFLDELEKSPIKAYEVPIKDVYKTFGLEPLDHYPSGAFLKGTKADCIVVESSKKIPYYGKIFVLFHEQGHFLNRKAKYNQTQDEKYANIYAFNKCRELGYEKSIDFGLAILAGHLWGDCPKFYKDSAKQLVKMKRFRRSFLAESQFGR